MQKRIFFGAILIAIVLGAMALDYWAQGVSVPAPGGRTVSLGGAIMVLILIAIASKGYLELAHLAAGAGVQMYRLSGLAGTILVLSLPWWKGFVHWMPGDVLVTAAAGAALLAVFVQQLACHRVEGVIARVGLTTLGIVYLGLCGSILLAIRLDFGLAALGLFLVAVKFTDIGAYFTGSAIGRHKMIPWLSPGKSWEGLVGGLALAGASSGVYAWLLNQSISIPAAIVFGVVVGAIGQAGDLCESALKRDAKMKDSAHVVPAFGGVLDIIDSPLLSAPAAYVLLAVLR